MKSKPKITKSPEGWVVKRPAFGFAPCKPDGPYPTHAAALDSLTVVSGGSNVSVELAGTPEPLAWVSFNSHRVWPGVIR